MQVDIDEMRLRAALDRAISRSFSRYLRATEKAREDFMQADETAWSRFYPWIRSAGSKQAEQSALAGYRNEVRPYADIYKRSLDSAESARYSDKRAIESALSGSHLEEKIRLLNRI